MSELAAGVSTRASDLPRKRRILAVLLGTLLAVFLSFLLIYTLYVRDGRSTNDVVVFIILPIIHAALLVGIPFLLIRKVPRLAAFDYTWSRWSRAEFGKSFAMPLGVALSIALTALLVDRFGLPTSRTIFYAHADDTWWHTAMLAWLTGFTVIVSPFVEEVFWRGYVQSTLTRLVHPAVAIIGQAALFGLIHFRPVLGFTQTSIYGLIFGLWCYRRKTLLPAIIMHMAINGVARTVDWVDWSELRQIRVTHDYVAEFIESSKPALYDPNEDARAEYATACRLVVDLPAELDGTRGTYPTQWDERKRIQGRDWVASNAEALVVLEQGTRRAAYWAEYEFRDGALPAFPTRLKGIRHLVFALSMRAKLNAVQGRHDDAFADLLTCCRLGEHLGGSKDTITYLMAMAVRGATAQTARLIIGHEQIDGTSLAQLQGELEGCAARNDLILDVTGERFRMMDTIQRLFTDDGRGGGHIPRCALRYGRSSSLVFPDVSKMAHSDINKWRMLDRRATIEALQRYYAAFGRLTALSPWEYERNVEGVKEAIEKIASENILVRTFSPTIRIGHMTARARVDIDSVICILAILRHRAAGGRLPESLDALVDASYLESVPGDPYGPGIVIYERLADDFLLYSRGADFDDDGGMPSKWGEGPEGGDQVFWPVRTGE